MAAEVAELKLSVENLERERDFYYQKLREVEVSASSTRTRERRRPSSRWDAAPATPPSPPPPPPAPHLPSLAPQDVLAILYKTDEADDFVAPADEQVA